MSNYPPGVTGNEPHLTGEYPCPACGGEGGDRDEDGFQPCWMCGGSGIRPEDAPACPECGSKAVWLHELSTVRQAVIATRFSLRNYEVEDAIFCRSCHEIFK